MKQLFIKSSFLITLFLILLIFGSSDASAAVGAVTGRVASKTTDVGIPNIWIKWVGPHAFSEQSAWTNVDGRTFPTDGNYPVRYALSDSNGDFIFPEWTSTHYSKEATEFRARQYLTWIKPSQPEIPPDSTAFTGIYLPYMSTANVNYGDRNAVPHIIQALQRAQSYRPQGDGWVRLANNAHADGGFQCSNNNPVIEAVLPLNWRGVLDNNGQTPSLANNTGDYRLSSTIHLSTETPIGYHDGNGFNGSDPKPITVSGNDFKVRGWARLPGDDSYRVNVDIYYKDVDPGSGQEISGYQAVTRTLADKFRADLNANVGFEYILPDNLRDGRPRNYYAFAVTGYNNPQLTFSPRQMIGEVDPRSTPTPTPPPAGGSSPTPTLPPGITPTPTPKPVTPPTDLTLDLWAQSGTKIAGKQPLNNTALEINVDEKAILTWDLGGNPNQCWASGDWGNLQYPPNTSFTTPTLSQIKTYPFTLTCYDLTTGRASVSDTVNITTKPIQTAPFIQTSGGDVHSNQKIETQAP